MPIAIIGLAALVSTTSCGGDSTPEPAKTSAKKAKKGKKANKGKKGKRAKRKAAAKSAGTSPTYTQAQKCAQPCLFMTQHSFETVQKKLCEWCPGNEYDYCELDWPSSDVPGCDTYEHLKNCVYAAYGYSFKKKRWNKEFKKTGWYTPNPAYDKSSHSKVAQANIKKMRDIATGKEPGCIDY